MDYWISDGLYGSMNCLVYDHAVLSPKPLYMVPNANQNTYSSTLFGPTCDGLDCVVRDVDLPLMHNGDWVLFPCMGAYTMAAGSDFNGFNITQVCKRADIIRILHCNSCACTAFIVEACSPAEKMR